MTPEQFASIMAQLNRIVRLLELQTFAGGEAPGCLHENAVDHGVYGDQPRAKMFCPDCNETFSALEG